MIYILITLFSLSCFGFEPIDPNKINQVKCYYGRKDETESEMNLLSRQCALDLCGSPSSPKSMNYTDQTLKSYIDQSKLKEFDSSIPAIKKIANKIFEQNNKLINKIEQMIKVKHGLAKEYTKITKI